MTFSTEPRPFALEIARFQCVDVELVADCWGDSLEFAADSIPMVDSAVLRGPKSLPLHVELT